MLSVLCEHLERMGSRERLGPGPQYGNLCWRYLKVTETMENRQQDIEKVFHLPDDLLAECGAIYALDLR